MRALSAVVFRRHVKLVRNYHAGDYAAAITGADNTIRSGQGGLALKSRLLITLDRRLDR